MTHTIVAYYADLQQKHKEQIVDLNASSQLNPPGSWTGCETIISAVLHRIDHPAEPDVV